MKILLLGEYSNVHATLAEGLRARGHAVTVASNGDFWKDYPRDIDLVRKYTKWGGVAFMLKLYALLPRFRGYDIVQLINPMFLEIKAERIFPIYRYLRRHNRKVVLGAFGMDWYWVHVCNHEKPLRYSDFNIGDALRYNADAVKERKDWLGTPKERLNRMMAVDCDAIVAGLYEYKVCYDLHHPDKTTFIPFPIVAAKRPEDIPPDPPRRVRVFIGINRDRSEYKGTDIMLRAALEVQQRHPREMELVKVESLPFAVYRKRMLGSDAILDQLYSYTPSMNPLQAMSEGIICVGGGEEENYDILHESELRPVINVLPSFESVAGELERLVSHPERIPLLKRQSVEYIRRHHDHLKVAARYEALYEGLLGRKD